MWNGNKRSLMLGKIEGKRTGSLRDETVIYDSITDSMNKNLSKLREIVKDRGTQCAAVHAVAESDTT